MAFPATVARSAIRLYGAEREESRESPAEPSWKNLIPAPLIRAMVLPAAPLVTMVACSGETMPMSLARMERTGPTVVGSWE